METKIVNVTPEIATEWLGSRRKERKLRPSFVSYLVEELKRGRFLLTHQGIAFNKTGELIDGQHRLEAIRVSGVSASLMVTTGIPSEAYEVFDRGIVRTISDVTDIKRRYVQIYSFLIDMSGRGGSYGQRVSPSDVISLHKYLGLIVMALESHSNNHSRFFGAAAIRGAAVVQVANGEDKDYVFNTYRALDNSDMNLAPPVARALLKKYLQHGMSFAKASGNTGMATARVAAYNLAVYTFSAKNKYNTRLRISPELAESFKSRASDIVKLALQPKIITLERDNYESKYRQQLKENIKLQEQVVDLLQIRNT